MDNKIYITNFWWAANYGANLTAYAINQIVSNSYLVDNSDCYQLIRESSFSFHKNFKKKYFNKIEKLCNIKNMDSLTFIVGSDQVFRPIINKNISETFMLNYAQPNSKKIAFSASFGVDKEQFVKENSQDTIAKMKNSLKSFDFISVREKSGVEICKDIFDIDAQWIIDPVFILEKAYYLELINNVSSTSKYKNKIVAHFVANKNTKINKYNDKKVIKLHNSNISVEEWLNAIRDCELLIADSYHAVCFAIIFNKPFIAITQQKHGKNILVVRYGTIGDTIFTVPFFKELRNINGNDCIIDFVVNNGNKTIAENIPYVDNLVNINEIAPLKIQNFYKWIPLLKKYDTVYFLCSSKVLSIFAFLAGIKVRSGFKFRNYEHNYFLTRETEYKKDIHATQAYLSLLGNKYTEMPEIEYENIFKNICDSVKYEINNKYIAIHPFSRIKLKNWEPSKWIEVIKYLTEKGFNIVLLGAKKDYTQSNELVISDKIHNLCGKTTFEETISIIHSSEIFMGIDSGLIHIAAVLNKKSILLNGSTSLTHWKPLNKNCKIITENFKCSPCCCLMTKSDNPTCTDVDCMKAICVEKVVSAIKEII